MVQLASTRRILAPAQCSTMPKSVGKTARKCRVGRAQRAPHQLGFLGICTGFPMPVALDQPRELHGEKGKAGMSVDGPAKQAARELGQGWKVSPLVVIKGKSTSPWRRSMARARSNRSG